MSRRFCLLRGRGDYYLECLRKFGNPASLWRMQFGPTYVYRPQNVQLVSLQILQCIRTLLQSANCAQLMFTL